jgi:acyl carrier protein
LRPALAADVCRIVAETQDLPVAAIGPDLRLEADLGVDSLAMIAITVGLEEDLGFTAPEIDEERVLAIVTVGDLIDFVAAEVAGQAELSR